MFQLTAVTQIPFAYIYAAMPIGGILLIVPGAFIARRYVLGREFAAKRAFRRQRVGIAVRGRAMLDPSVLLIVSATMTTWPSACPWPFTWSLATATTPLLALRSWCC